MKSYAYFQGGGGPNEPTPKKKKYKSDEAIVVQPRFKEPFYSNYDLYDVGDTGPGTRKKKKKLKYEADDSWITPNGKIKKRKIALRKLFYYSILKQSMDFTLDDQIKSDPIIGDYETFYQSSTPMGGRFDGMEITDTNVKNKDLLTEKQYDEPIEGDPIYRNMSPSEIQEMIDLYYGSASEKDKLSVPVNNEDSFYNKNLYYGIINTPKSKLNAI